MEISSARTARFEPGDPDQFMGDVVLRRTVGAPDGTSVAVVHFSPGSRTFWHRHPGGQFLYGVTGRGRVRSRGEPGHLLEPGDVVFVEPGVWHFHGAEKDAPMVHVAVNGAGPPEFGNPVDDDEFDEGF
jgi:quercetin dioxygenase-like cupin family protein